MARIGATLKKTASACIALAVLAILLALMLVGYLFFERQVAAEVYRDRLAEISGEYEQLRERYNTAISKTAVTELEVAGGVLTVRVRDAGGVIREIPTELDPSGEIYVDYVVLDGRLWIRRVFDANTPPAEALVIDPELADIEWPTGELAHGKAVYRSLDEGRWMVTVTGNGSLGTWLQHDSQRNPRGRQLRRDARRSRHPRRGDRPGRGPRPTARLELIGLS